jgi:hypothetical protein
MKKVIIAGLLSCLLIVTGALAWRHFKHTASDKEAVARAPVVAWAKAEVERKGQHLESVCDTTIAKYDSFNQVQDAYATLTLSGLHDVLIRPEGQSGRASVPSSYDLLIPHDSAISGAAALRATNICELKRFEELSNAVSVVSMLSAHNIQTTFRPLKKDEQEASSYRVFAVYVRRSDEEAAKVLLAAP